MSIMIGVEGTAAINLVSRLAIYSAEIDSIDFDEKCNNEMTPCMIMACIDNSTDVGRKKVAPNDRNESGR